MSVRTVLSVQSFVMVPELPLMPSLCRVIA